MPPISQRFGIPTNADIFEEMCRDLLRLYWSRPHLERFGKRGERQFGIDILDVGGKDPLCAAQCKLKEAHKNLSPAVIQAEVNEAKLFIPPLGKYGILTTAKVSTQAQRKIREINQAHQAAGIFEVELLTWENICELLQRYSEVQEHFYEGTAPKLANKIESAIVALRGGVESLTSKVEGSEIDAQINDARDSVTKREFQLATLLLNRVQQAKGHLLNPYQKFRVSSNLGAAAFGAGKLEAASKYFLEALSHQPNDERAKTNEVLAYLLVGDNATAHSKADNIRLEYPASTALATYWITSAPRNKRFTDLESALSSIVRSDAEVSLALARRALMESNLESAAVYTEAAARVAPRWAQPQFLTGQINLGRIIMADAGQHSLAAPRNSVLEAAEAAFSHAIRLAEDDKDVKTHVDALVGRVDVRLLLKKTTEAEEDADAAYRLNSVDPHVLLARSQIQFSANHIAEGIATLEKAYQIEPRFDVAFTYGRALFTRSQGSDLDDAIKIFLGIDLEQAPPSLRAAAATQTIQCLIKKKDWPETTKYVEKVESHLEPVVVAALRGYLAHHEGLLEEAERQAASSQLLVSATTPAETKEFLGRLFVLIGRPADALPLFQELFDADIFSFDAGNLLDCAARLHRDDVVIETCDRLHGRGVIDWRLVDFEVQYLEKYHTEKAIQRLDGFIREHPDHKLAKLRRSIIGVKTNRPELVASSVDELPDVTELPIENAMAAVHVLKFGGNADAAVDYAYRLLRLRFQNMEAHQAFILTLLPGDPAPNIPPFVEEVAGDTAVCYQELPNGDPKWVVLENTDRPVKEFEEVSLDSPLALELLHKRRGDTFVLAEGSMHTRRAVIHQILPKYVRRFQDCMGEMQVRFGRSSPVESLPLGSSKEEMQEGLKTILESVKRRASAVAQVRGLYDELPVSLHCYGDRLGKNAYVGLLDLAQEDGHSIKCCLGTVEERHEAVYALQTAQAVVVDLTALATLRLLDLERLLSTNRFKFILTEGTWNELQEMLSDLRIFSGPSETIGYRHGTHTLHEESAELKSERLRNNEIFLEHIKKSTQIVPVLELAALNPSKREPLEEFLGHYGAESIVLASNPDYVLWTDDVIQAQIAAKEFGVRRAWTQLIIGHLAEGGLLTAKQRDAASAQLVGMGFTATLFDSSAILEAVNLTEATPWHRPLKQIIDVFANPQGDIRNLLAIFVDFVVKLYREPLLPETRCRVVGAFLDALWKNPKARSALLNIRKSSPRFFGLNAVGETQFNECFDRWLKQLENPIISPS